MAMVFQYGSNCDQRRLNAPCRLDGAATVPEKAQTVEDYELAFDKWSTKNKCAAANLVRRGSRKAWGILYDIPDDRIDGHGAATKRTLADIEGPSYEKKFIEVTTGLRTISAVTFMVKADRKRDDRATKAEYVSYIVGGLRAHEVPEEYVDHVIDVAIANVRSVCGAAGEILKIERLRKPR